MNEILSGYLCKCEQTDRIQCVYEQLEYCQQCLLLLFAIVTCAVE